MKRFTSGDGEILKTVLAAAECAADIEIDNRKVLQVRKKPIIVHAIEMNKVFEVETLEGTLSGKKGDYLMIGVNGELYPIDREIFEKTYDILNQ